jgi:predicted nucleic acid-binding protein
LIQIFGLVSLLPKITILLNLAVDSNADFLITGDQDLLELKKIANAKILTFRELEKKLDKV